MPSLSGYLPGMWNANHLPGASPSGIPNHPSAARIDLTGSPQPLPISVEDQIRLSKKTRWVAFSGHSFEQARMLDPGNAAWPFTALGLVEFSPIGPGVLNRDELRKTLGAPLFAEQTASVTGLGGIVMGGVRQQALVSPPPPNQSDLAF